MSNKTLTIIAVVLIVFGLVVLGGGDGNFALSLLISGAVLLGAAFLRKLVLDAVKEARRDPAQRQ